MMIIRFIKRLLVTPFCIPSYIVVHLLWAMGVKSRNIIAIPKGVCLGLVEWADK